MILLNGQPLSVTHFPDNTSQVWKIDNLDKLTEAKVTWQFSHEGEFMQLAQLKTLLDSYGIKSELHLSYLPYGRQDKAISNEATFGLHTFAALLNSLNFSKVTIRDPHSLKALNLIKNSKDVYPCRAIDQILFEHKYDLICYPDAGAKTKYAGKGPYSIYNFPPAVIFGDKVRDQATGNITSYALQGECAGKNVLIVDDICDGGATFKILAKCLLDKGAKSVALFVTHGIFSKGVRTLIDSGIARVFTADGEVGPRHNSQNI
jgi:ribose-phosphate pyrophosphokinase